MSSVPKEVPKLKDIRLTKEERVAITNMVASEGFKVWADKIVKTREIQIALTGLAVAQDNLELYYYKGLNYENAQVVKELREIAEKVDDDLDDVDDNDEGDGVTDDKV